MSTNNIYTINVEAIHTNTDNACIYQAVDKSTCCCWYSFELSRLFNAIQRSSSQMCTNNIYTFKVEKIHTNTDNMYIYQEVDKSTWDVI